jgi:hypothetical protein
MGDFGVGIVALRQSWLLVAGPGGGHAPEDGEGIAVSYFVKDEMVVFHLVTQPSRSGVSAAKFGNVLPSCVALGSLALTPPP